MFLLDTNVISELRKLRAGTLHEGVKHWVAKASPSSLYLSVVTVEELEIGTRRIERRDLPQGLLLRRWIEEYVLTAFDDHILPISLEIARASAALQVPDPRPIRDAYIAATALVHDLTVVTRNPRDFIACGARALNPWKCPRNIASPCPPA